ncbi:MAG: helix-turn-helix domain-containing protein [Pseudomonadota bacterium]|jgi:excisionase family DNA binding protein|nr:helix-turn-helix domain-containing protein [Pseudomonadota bacterium]MED5538686.1 helix-turn-helix domain-containing protein [Pseudomonadota bacterium]
MSAANDNKLAYGIEEAAQAIGVGKSTIWRWVHDGRVKTIKLGGRTLIRREELMRLLDEAA